MVYTLLFFFSSKCSLFHNSNVFGSCVIHILYTGCAKNNSGAKSLRATKKLWMCSGRIACSVYIYLRAQEYLQLILLPSVVERKPSELKRSFFDPEVKKVNQSHYRPGQAQRVLRKLRFPDIVTTVRGRW